jgi:hypothetical protein
MKAVSKVYIGRYLKNKPFTAFLIKIDSDTNFNLKEIYVYKSFLWCQIKISMINFLSTAVKLKYIGWQF